MIDIRVLTPEDWRLWRELRLAALTDAPYAFGSRLADWQGTGDREARWRGRLSLPGSHNLLAYHEGGPAGMVSGAPAETERDTVELLSFWVDPRARGRGVADRLVDEVEAWAKLQGARYLRLAVTPGNSRALAFYRRRGLIDSGHREPSEEGRKPEIVMVKTLTGEGRPGVSPPNGGGHAGHGGRA